MSKYSYNSIEINKFKEETKNLISLSKYDYIQKNQDEEESNESDELISTSINENSGEDMNILTPLLLFGLSLFILAFVLSKHDNFLSNYSYISMESYAKKKPTRSPTKSPTKTPTLSPSYVSFDVSIYDPTYGYPSLSKLPWDALAEPYKQQIATVTSKIYCMTFKSSTCTL